jgi:hypothetical protein
MGFGVRVGIALIERTSVLAEPMVRDLEFAEGRYWMSGARRARRTLRRRYNPQPRPRRRAVAGEPRLETGRRAGQSLS